MYIIYYCYILSRSILEIFKFLITLIILFLSPMKTVDFIIQVLYIYDQISHEYCKSRTV